MWHPPPGTTWGVQVHPGVSPLDEALSAPALCHEDEFLTAVGPLITLHM
jgi:hypothetical protein